MSWPTDEMVKVADRILRPHGTAYPPDSQQVRDALVAALAAAPAVDGWVWCEASAWEHIPGEPINLDSFAPCRNGDCPGPHRTLLLGPEVEA